ncbi:phospholipase [Roseomonas hellenica]|uniref:Phospholipase D n=1 Tax=Plastoroseomonas hellenica TaxID=2687306 RepID=A0ABS5F4Z9_9PROT|nr:phospholipase D-like domain-containing protein [Plastoroseomonas hellenica]MBR0667656.1 phospholipase [Plastoroseomonas hellenica]
MTSGLAIAEASPADPTRAGWRSVLRPGETCWRVEAADRVALLLDCADYFAAARQAMLRARHSILLLGWDFDPRTRLQQYPTIAADGLPVAIGELLNALAARRPALDIRVLVWDMSPLIAIGRDMSPRRAASWFRDGLVRYRLTAATAGACHHQKLLVIDDAIAFCGGGDFAIDRWDTPRHPDRDPRRRQPSGEEHPPRHEVMALVDGAAAAALGKLARRRWQDETGERPPSLSAAIGDPWPDAAPPDLLAVPRIGIARTMSPPDGQAVRENEPLHLACIAAARRCIYLENQYFSSSRVAAALAARLAEPDGPEIILMLSRQSPSFFDRMTMDAPRDTLVARLQAADRHGRFHAYTPVTAGGRAITVHSKVTIIDDRMLRVGSSNLNNRSGGYDTECDLLIEAPVGPEGGRIEAAIRNFRNRLIAHFLGVDTVTMGRLATQAGSLAQAIETLDAGGHGRLRRLAPRCRPGLLGRLVAHLHLGDPHGVEDAWRPWRRQA